jgi:hypothetical protein
MAPVIQHRANYEDALDLADEVWRTNRVDDDSAMEQLIESLLARQLARVYEMAGGKVQHSGGTSLVTE